MKKILFISLFILISLLPNHIKALESSFYEGEYIPDMYIKKFKNGNNTGKYEHMKVFRRKEDNRVVYCLELWESLNSNKSINGNEYPNYYNIDRSTLDRIVLIAYYGYGYKNHTDIKWYGVTQFMIWKEIEKDSNIFFTDTLNGNRVNKYESEMNEIYDLVNKHNILPSFNDKYIVNYNEEFQLVDTNNVLENYTVGGNLGVMHIKEGNTLRITIKDIGDKNMHFRKIDNLYNSNPIIYIDNNGQNVLLPGSYPKIEKKITFSINANIIKIHKYLKEEDNTIPEKAKFNLYDSNGVLRKVIETDDNGYYEIALPYGIYTLRQVEGTPNHKFIDDLEINSNSNNTIQEFNLYNEELIVPVQITNLDSESNLPILENGAEFIIKNNDTNEEITLTTDDLGKTDIIDLKPGSYEIKQIKAVTNYLKDENIINIDINDSNFSYDKEIYNINILNEKEKSKIEVSKLINYYLNDELINTEEDNDLTIPIYAKNDIYTKDGIKMYNKDEEVDIVSKNNNRLSKELIYGDYYINNKNEIINLSLNNPETKEVKLIEDIYKYTEIDNVPNTYIEDKNNNNSYILMVLLGSYLLYWSKKYENN